jgi:hypothetical protein
LQVLARALVEQGLVLQAGQVCIVVGDVTGCWWGSAALSIFQ